VVLGDPYQLPSTVINETCKASGYGESFLSHVMQYQPKKVHLLNTQYRMDPSILQFSNDAFYEGGILSDGSVYNREPSVDVPFKFIDTSGAGIEESEGSSWLNEYEGVVVRYLLQNDTDIGRLLENGSGSRIIIISPYSAQVNLLKNMVRRKRKSLRGCDIDVATVDSFQGQEADIVIVSMVRTKSVGFVGDAQRLNVALTRAKRVLRVVGDLAFFKSLVDEEDSILRRLALFAAKNKIDELARVSTESWLRPDWTTVTKWKPTSTFREKISRLDRDPCPCAIS
jgi:superfamily I DNA and/or RNA helicase